MTLPSAWVDRIFEKLTLTYGHQFLGRWSGLDVDAVKADWAHELAGFENRPDAVRHALQNLPVKDPPTVRQFVAACVAAPTPAVKALPAPKPDEAFVGAVLDRLEASRAQNPERLTPAQQCERNIIASANLFNGGRLSAAQRSMLQAMQQAGLIGGVA